MKRGLESESARIRTAIERGLGVWERTVSDRVPTFRFKQTSAAELRFVWVENKPEHTGGQTWIRLGPGGTQLRPESIKIPFRMLSPNPAHPERLETIGAHDHLLIETDAHRRLALNDPRRFGSLDLVPTDDEAPAGTDSALLGEGYATVTALDPVRPLEWNLPIGGWADEVGVPG